jgi:hypothetical protein
MRPRSYLLSLAISLALFAVGFGEASVWAGGPPATDKDRTHNSKDSKDTKDKDNTLPASVRRIERETGGKVLKAQPIERDGREIYRVKIVTPQGRVRVVEDDVGPPPPQPPPSDPLPPPDIRHRL